MNAATTLETIIRKLEAWQARNAQHDPGGLAVRAKSELLQLLRELENGKGTP